MLLLTESLRTIEIVSLALVKALLMESLIWSGLKLVGGVLGLRIRVLSSGVGSRPFFEALVLVEVVVDGLPCLTILAQVLFPVCVTGVVVEGVVSWSSLVRMWFKVSSCLVIVDSIACGIGGEEGGGIGAASGM